MQSKVIQLLILIVLVTTACSPRTGDDETSPADSNEYINNVGSDTMVNLALAWAEQYQMDNPQSNLSVSGGGSGTGIASLINKTTDLANASRKIKSEEIVNAQANGIEPVEFIVARDAIAVIVNPNNPISQLTLQQLSDIYSGKINNWQELGGEDRPIVRLSRETNSGTHVYFLEQVLRLGDKNDKTLFSTDTLLLPSSEVIGAEIRSNPNAIGYDGLGYVTLDMKVIALTASQLGDPDFIYPSSETVNDGTYPIARDLYMYTAGEPVGFVKKYIGWIYTPQAQEIVSDLGFVPILAK
ncbi:MAG TPA: PstS family phosphate ABC transporter substrate-binding protein [Anaerolineales bacterium]|nr:PstS family phosphate ABC transporter substrate-binding protein [Anaerolineales bacterium]